MGKTPLKYWEAQATVAEIGQVVSSDVDRNEKTENPKDHGKKNDSLQDHKGGRYM